MKPIWLVGLLLPVSICGAQAKHTPRNPYAFTLPRAATGFDCWTGKAPLLQGSPPGFRWVPGADPALHSYSACRQTEVTVGPNHPLTQGTWYVQQFRLVHWNSTECANKTDVFGDKLVGATSCDFSGVRVCRPGVPLNAYTPCNEWVDASNKGAYAGGAGCGVCVIWFTRHPTKGSPPPP
jgi:hypothetical protein